MAHQYSALRTNSNSSKSSIFENDLNFNFKNKTEYLSTYDNNQFLVSNYMSWGDYFASIFDVFRNTHNIYLSEDHYDIHFTDMTGYEESNACCFAIGNTWFTCLLNS